MAKKPKAKKDKQKEPAHPATRQRRASTLAIAEQRKALIMQVLVRRPGIPLRGISRVLAEGGHGNPETGEPWSHEIIRRDLNQAKKEWAAAKEKDADTVFGRVYHTALEAIGEGFRLEQLSAGASWARIIMDLFGLKAPEEIKGEVHHTHVIGGMSEEDF